MARLPFMVWAGGSGAALCLFALVPAMARADDHVTTGSAPAWVTAVRADQRRPVGAAPLLVLLQDQQVAFTGPTTSLYEHRVLRIDAAAGIGAMTRFGVQWRPDTDHITIHTLCLRRGGRTSDLLPDLTGMLARRAASGDEPGLRLDGQRNLALPISGIAVGDVVEIAYTIDRVEPLMQGHHELVLDAGTHGGIADLRIAAHLAPGIAVAGQNLPAAMARRGDRLRLSARVPDALAMPGDAPDRFRRGRQLAFSDFAGWDQVGALVAPLFAQARRLAPDSPLRAEIARIRAATPDPAQQAGMVLALAEERVRYLYVGLGQGNLRPLSADQAWQRGFADCKGKVALLLGLLDGLGIAADPALVSTKEGDGLDQSLPGLSRFDHVIVRARIAGRDVWLDPTRQGDSDIAQVPMPDLRWALVLGADRPALVAMTVPVQARPGMVYALDLDASHGIGEVASASGTIVIAGDNGRQTWAMLSPLTPERRQVAVAGVWTAQYPFVTPITATARWDEVAARLELAMRGTARMAWRAGAAGVAYEMDGSRLGWPAPAPRGGGGATAPLAIAFPDYVEWRENVTLPGDAAQFAVAGGDIDQALAGRALYRHVTRRGATVTMIAYVRPLASEVPYAEALAAVEPIAALARTPVTITAAPVLSLATPHGRF